MARLFLTALLAFVVLGSSLWAAEEPAPAATPQQIQQSVERAAGYLQAECAAWLKSRQCASCHHAPMVLWALSEADRHGYAVDEKFVAETTESLLGSKERLIAAKLLPNPEGQADTRPEGRALNMGLPFLAVATYSMPALTDAQKQAVKLMTEEIVNKQQPDGSWEFFAGLRRPPVNETQLTDAAWIILALDGETGPEVPDPHRTALSKAITWFNAAESTGLHQEKVFRLLLAARTKKPREALQPMIDELLKLQRADGGWSQTIPEPKSDAFATGQTLYIMSLVGVTADRPEIQRAIDFLVATQAPDGSWPMTSRSRFDGGEGGSKLLTPITCAASSWATLGLVGQGPRINPQTSALEKR